MSRDTSKSSEHCHSKLLSTAKTVAKWISSQPLYISYLIFFSSYILKLLYFLSPLLILLLAAALCAFSTTTSANSSYHVICNETQENASSTPLEAAAYNIIFETFHDSVTSLADESDEVEACKKIRKEALAPEMVKSCCTSTPLHDPPLHEIVAKTAICGEKELSTKAAKSDDETEIIKHIVCSTIIEQDEHKSRDEERVKEAVEVEINKAERRPLPTIHKSGSNAAIESTEIHKTCKSCDLSSIGSMRREKEWTRTLACKLFEERHNSRGGGGEDGMDMLWETYDEEESIISPEPRDEHRRGTMSRRSCRSAKMMSIRVSYADEEEEEKEDEDEDDDVAVSGKMCCLQALKMSSGKVNLGIKTKNMIKISKAFRGFGIGWLHKTINSSNANTRK